MFRRLLPSWLLLTAAVAAVAGRAAETGPPAPEIVREVLVRLERFERGGGDGAGRFSRDLRFRRGDDPAWSTRDFDDTGWERISNRDLPSRDGIYWVRWRLHQRSARLEFPRDGILLKIVASFDLYWDGRLLGRNGRVSAVADDESPGVVDALFQIPPELLGPGEHVIALRLSSHHTGFPGATYAVNFEWGNFRTMLVQRSRTSLLSVMAVGAALLVAIIFGLMWLLAGRRRALALFSLLFLVVAALQALQAWRWLFEYRYDWHHPRLVAISLLATALAVLLPAFLLEQFQLRRRAWVFGVLAVLLLLAWRSSPIYNWVSLYACAVGFGVSLALAARAVWLRRRGAGFAGGGLALSVAALAVTPRDFLDQAFFLSAGPAFLGLLVAQVLQLREERREARQAVLTAARLEIELLKKNIQPHFLMNSLASLTEVIEQSPAGAAALIEALAGEFRILARVSGEKLIPLAQELELCDFHLRVMSMRQGTPWQLERAGLDPEWRVPPALFHTLLENGITHSEGRARDPVFHLRGETRDGVVRFTLVAPLATAAGPESPPAAAPREGTGLRYVKARLEESFPGRWTMQAGLVAAGWQTTIEIRPAP